MAISNVKIANRALQLLGSSSRIESLSEDSPNARSLSVCFEQVRDAALRKHTWTFAKTRAEIAADGDDAEWGGWHRYSKPNDFLRLIRDNETGFAVDWQIEGDFILSADTSPLQLKYVRKVTDPNSYDSLFVEVYAVLLAIATCKEITGSESSKESLKNDYDALIAEAKRIGSIEEPAQEFPEDSWILARL